MSALKIRLAVGALAIGSLSFPGSPARAQDLAIVGAEVHVVASPSIPTATVLIRDGRIAAVGVDIAVPEGVPVFDATGKVVTPGLFDPASSIGLVEVSLVSQTRDQTMADEDDPIAAAFDPRDALNPRSTLIPYNRVYGLTTTATGPRGGLISGRAAVIDLAGETVEEMVVEPVAAILATLGEAGAERAGGSRGEAALRLRETLEDARFWAENRAAFRRGQTRPVSESRLDLEALQPVLDRSIPLVVAAHRASDIRAVLRIARDFRIRPVILGGAEAWMVADELARAEVPVILKPLMSLPRAFERLGSRFDNAKILADAGVSIAFSAFENHRAHGLLHEAGNATRFGLSRDAAIEAITLAPSKIYGVDDRYGTLEPGKVANVVIWTGDPLELSSRAEAVLIRGRIVPDWSRSKELLQRYRSIDQDRPPAYTVPSR
jgi:imidazolonepropionase-like amidohydrolase